MLPCLSSMLGTEWAGRGLEKVREGLVDMETLKEPSFLSNGATPKHCCLALPNKELSPQENSQYSYSSPSYRHLEDYIVTPFAQILASLRTVRANYIHLTNIPAK